MEDLREFMDEISALIDGDEPQVNEEVDEVVVSDDVDDDFSEKFGENLALVLAKVEESGDNELMDRVKSLAQEFVQELRSMVEGGDDSEAEPYVDQYGM